MSPKDKELFSVDNEIAVHPDIPHEAASEENPLTETVGSPASSDSYYLSVAFEPGIPGTHTRTYSAKLAAEGAKYTIGKVLLITLLCGLIGGFVSVPAVFLQGNKTRIAILLIVVFGPFVEESCKQIGMIFQLEKIPASVKYAWQFFVVAVIGGAIFSALENLIYEHVYLAKLPAERLAEIMAFRWKYCVMLHVFCPLISAFGLYRVWKRSLKEGLPCKIEKAFYWFVAAMTVHGLYNLTMIFLEKNLFKTGN
ncbi:MAG: PrsW family intramembrane metalloprotease [Victivallales bacterium]|nr:PrsW family intramembrane metalloprotease [Victivallales bacterium]